MHGASTHTSKYATQASSATSNQDGGKAGSGAGRRALSEDLVRVKTPEGRAGVLPCQRKDGSRPTGVAPEPRRQVVDPIADNHPAARGRRVLRHLGTADQVARWHRPLRRWWLGATGLTQRTLDSPEPGQDVLQRAGQHTEGLVAVPGGTSPSASIRRGCSEVVRPGRRAQRHGDDWGSPKQLWCGPGPHSGRLCGSGYMWAAATCAGRTVRPAGRRHGRRGALPAHRAGLNPGIIVSL
eukprot:COSAG01_NODE_35_length_34814_cov_128.883624_19_plen_239_part_00